MAIHEIFFAPLILLIVVVLPLWIIFHYTLKLRTAKGLSADEQALILELRDLADRMDERLMTIERILDADKPDWRSDR